MTALDYLLLVNIGIIVVMMDNGCGTKYRPCTLKYSVTYTFIVVSLVALSTTTSARQRFMVRNPLTCARCIKNTEDI